MGLTGDCGQSLSINRTLRRVGELRLSPLARLHIEKDPERFGKILRGASGRSCSISLVQTSSESSARTSAKTTWTAAALVAAPA